KERRCKFLHKSPYLTNHEGKAGPEWLQAPWLQRTQSCSIDNSATVTVLVERAAPKVADTRNGIGSEMPVTAVIAACEVRVPLVWPPLKPLIILEVESQVISTYTSKLPPVDGIAAPETVKAATAVSLPTVVDVPV